MDDVQLTTHADDRAVQRGREQAGLPLPASLLVAAAGLSLLPGFFLAMWFWQTTPAERRAADAVRAMNGALATESDLTYQVTSVAFDLAEQSFGDAQLAQIFPQLQAFRQLDTLSLRKTAVTSAGMAYVGQLTELRTLSLQRTNVSDAGLARLKGLKKLEHLVLVQTRITDDGLQHLTAFPNLRTLLLSKTDLGDGALVHLQDMTSLRELYIGFTRITDAGLAYLRGLRNLEVLSLQWTDVTDAGLQHVAELQNLKDLSVYEADVTDSGIAELRRALPNIRILAGQIE